MDGSFYRPGLTYGSVCSGIEAASVAWHPLRWRAAFLSEIEPFPRSVLAHHYPSTPLHGDFTTIQAGQYDAVDVLVGGTPCQSFSVAGLRGGMADERGNLALEYLRLADRLRPRWLLWENVPGVLSSNGGRDFGSFLGGLGQLGYGFAYRVLDAQYFGLAQRRKRVFVVGYLGDWRRAAAVLFEPGSVRGHPAPSRPAREGVAAPAAGGAGKRRRPHGGGAGAGSVIAPSVALRGRVGGNMAELGGDICPSMRTSTGGSDKLHVLAPAVAHALRVPSNGAAWRGDGADNLVAHTFEPGTATALRARDSSRGVDSDCTDTLIPVCYRLHADGSTAMRGPGTAAAAAPVDITRALDTCGGFAAGQGGNLVLDGLPQGCTLLGAVPILEAGARTGKASATERAGMGIGQDGDPMFTLQSGKQHAVAFSPAQITSPGNRSTAEPGAPCPTLAGKDEPPAVAFIHCNKGRPDGRKSAHTDMVTVKPMVETLTTDCHAQSAVQAADAVRRLTPRECERLQGFPDDYTLIPTGAARKVEADYLRYLQLTRPDLTEAEAERLAKDGPRYRALGNSMAVPVMAWIGRRIAAVDAT